jgi:hypothetical protein
MTDLLPRLFATNADIVRIGEGLLDRSLPRPDWTHEAHLAACLYLVRERPDIDVDAQIAGIISGYNAAVGGVNDDTQGYHDTITRVFVHGVRWHHAKAAWPVLVVEVNALLMSAVGARDWPLRFYSRALLFSVAARRNYLPPDLAPLPGMW